MQEKDHSYPDVGRHPNLIDWFGSEMFRQGPNPGYTIDGWRIVGQEITNDYPKGDDRKWRLPMTMPCYTIPVCGAENESKLLSLLDG